MTVFWSAISQSFREMHVWKFHVPEFQDFLPFCLQTSKLVFSKPILRAFLPFCEQKSKLYSVSPFGGFLRVSGRLKVKISRPRSFIGVGEVLFSEIGLTVRSQEPCLAILIIIFWLLALWSIRIFQLQYPPSVIFYRTSQICTKKYIEPFLNGTNTILHSTSEK